MMEGKNYGRWVRSLIAAGLAVLFSFASLTPLAATALTPVTGCATKAKCCCRKAHHTEGPAISGRTCQSDCGRITLGGSGITIYAQPRTGTSSLVIASAGLAPAAPVFAHLQRPAGSLRQRPPPSQLLA
jgi:hypothetical protein